jgi:DNA replication protein DnaC
MTATSGEEKKPPRHCERCGEPQEPIWVPGLNLWVSKGLVCGECERKEAEAAKEHALKVRRETILEALAHAGVPERYRVCTFDRGPLGSITWFSKAKPVVAECIQYAQKPDGGLLLIGATGRGKTQLAVAILREVLLRREPGRYENCAELLTSLRKVYQAKDDDEDDSEARVFDRLGRGLIILDDLGADRLTPMARAGLTFVVDRCLRRWQPVVLTTNMTADQIAEQIDTRMASRLAELCGGGSRIFILDGPDYRLRVKDRKQ